MKIILFHLSHCKKKHYIMTEFKGNLPSSQQCPILHNTCRMFKCDKITFVIRIVVLSHFQTSSCSSIVN